MLCRASLVRRFGSVLALAALAVSASCGGDTTAPPEDLPPTAQNVTATGLKNTPVTVTALGTDPEGRTLTFSVGSQPSNGTVGSFTPVDASSAQIVYMPAAGFSGQDQFTYVASDGTNVSSAATATITIENQAPTADAGPDQSEIERGTVVNLDGSGSSDPDGDELTFSWTLSDPAAANRTSLLSDASAEGPTFTPDASGVWTATLTVTDGTDESTDAVEIDVKNNPPTGPAGGEPVVVQTVGDGPVTITLSADDADGDALTFAIETGPTNGTLGPIIPSGQVGTRGAVAAATVSTATVDYTPNQGFSGEDGFTYTASDGTATAGPFPVEITVFQSTATPAGATTRLNTPRLIQLMGTGPEGVQLTFAIDTEPASGTLGEIAVMGLNTAFVNFVPDVDFVGGDSFTFTVDFQEASLAGVRIASAPATVDVTVEPVDDPAVAVLFPGQSAMGIFSTTTQKFVGLVKLGTTPFAVAVDPGIEFAYVINAGDETVSIVQASPLTEVAVVPVGTTPTALDVHPSGKFVYVTNGGSGSISVIRRSTQALSRTIALPAGSFPSDVAFSSDGTQAYVADTGLGTVWIVETSADVATEYPDAGPLAVRGSFGDHIIGNFGNSDAPHIVQFTPFVKDGEAIDVVGVKGFFDCFFDTFVRAPDGQMDLFQTADSWCDTQVRMPKGNGGLARYGSGESGDIFELDLDGIPQPAGNFSAGTGNFIHEAIFLPNRNIFYLGTNFTTTFDGFEGSPSGSILRSTALDIEASDFDQDSGAGILDAGSRVDPIIFADGFESGDTSAWGN